MNNVKQSIGWADYTINPVKGLCPVACSYCYARAMYRRFKWNPEIRYMPPHELGAQLNKIKEPSRIFVGSTMELFGDWIDRFYMTFLLAACANYPQHTFIFLTKRPENLIRWTFPANCWVGVSITRESEYCDRYQYFNRLKTKVKFISFEPLLEQVFVAGSPYYIEGHPLSRLSEADVLKHSGCNWVIIGAQSPYSKKTFPKWEWIKEIVTACDKTGIPVFLKNNLGLPKYSCEGATPFYKRDPSGTMILRQEFPDAKV